MEHFEGFSSTMVDQSALPAVGSSLIVEGWHRRGYVQRLELSLQAARPDLGFSFDNRSSGGSTSRDVLRAIRTFTEAGDASDLAFFGCGINDVWRRFQGRPDQAVGIDEYAGNYRAAIRLLAARSRRVICIGETPFGWDQELDVAVMNRELEKFNAVAAEIARGESADFIDVWPAFTVAANQLRGWNRPKPAPSLWSDGVHMSELGDALLLRLVEGHLDREEIIAQMTRNESKDR